MYYGQKNTDGTVDRIEMMKISSSSKNLNSIVRLDDRSRPQSLVVSNGVTIDLEWESEKQAVVKVFNPIDNSYISTLWYLDSIPQTTDLIQTKSAKKVENRRKGELDLQIVDFPITLQTRGTLDNYPSFQSCTYNIYQCGYPVDVYNWIGLVNKKKNKFIENIYYDSNPSSGVYHYKLPLNSYPSEATHEELCKKIDGALTVVGAGLQYLAAMEYGLAVWLNYVAVATGVGVIPAAITDALVLVTVGANFTVQLISDAGGVENIMKSLNPEWFYEEYITSDLELLPFAFINGKAYAGKRMVVSPESGDITINQEIDGEPTIDSFKLVPSHPAAYIPYKAYASYHCIPVGSNINISIVGTDGYTNSINKTITNTSGTAYLHVPGTYQGVYDVCTVVITTPDNRTIKMQASLVFG